jgi:hypothetical protein
MSPSQRKSAQHIETRPADRARLGALIEEATVDAYDESEQAMGFHAMLSEHVDLPFKTKVLGLEVSVTDIELAEDDSIVAICAAGAARQRIGLLDLPLPAKRPDGAEWIDAYRLWCRGSTG